MGPGFGGSETAVPGGSVTAKIVDTGGAAVASQPIYICGIDLCSPPATTDASGNANLTTNLMMKIPAFKFGDAVNYAEFSVRLSMASTDLGTLTTAKFPATGATMTAGADASNGGVTLSVPAGASVDVDPLVYDTPDKQGFKAVAVPVDKVQPMVDQIGTGFEVLYAVSPAETRICPAAKLDIPNTAGWAASAAVEFWVTTLDAGQEYAPYAGWTKVTDGAVSADGTRVTTTTGVESLNHFAVRLKP